MRTIQETRLECLRLANLLATTKIISHHEVITRAESYYKWVYGQPEPVRPETLTALREHYGKEPF